ncbi:hypothetical protein ACQR0Z_14965 [Bradyrhizobium sp. HKCCYLS3077]|uniref:hypothetical protein n=1 Tax=Bradyrhizobium sp. HKCCYLS3077 TaxID=3420761 RepID=UPI003EC125FD
MNSQRRTQTRRTFGNARWRLPAAAFSLLLWPVGDAFSQGRMADWSTCCLGLTFQLGRAVEEATAKNGVAMKPPNERSMDLISAKFSRYPEQCRRLSELLSISAKRNAYYPIVVAKRVCETVAANDDGLFEIKFYGTLPYNELEQSKRYRLTFFSRLQDLSISTAQGMSTSRNVFIEVVLNVNVQYEPAPGDSTAQPIVSISCRGRWRHFFTRPDKLDELFNSNTEAFSVIQNDECESSIKNSLESPPSLISSR